MPEFGLLPACRQECERTDTLGWKRPLVLNGGAGIYFAACFPNLRTVAGDVAALEALLKHLALKLSLCGGLGLLGFLGGCGESTSFEGPTPIPITELPTKYATALCVAYGSCLGPLLPVFLAGEDCTTNLRRVLEDELPNFQAAVMSGKATYDGTQLQACVDKLAGLGCDAIYQRDVCVTTLSGAVAAGQACTMDVECAKGNYCKGVACPGTCSPREAAGGSCDSDTDCASGLECNSGACETLAKLDEACGVATSPECSAGLVCVDADSKAKKPGKCRPNAEAFKGSVSESCDPQAGVLCKEGSVCTIQSWDLAGLVATCTAPLAAGAACKASYPDACPLDEYCKLSGNIALRMVDGTCTKKPKAGEPCGVGLLGGDICAPNWRCNQDKKCIVEERVGGACESADICYSGTCTGGKCVAGGQCN